MTEHADFDPIAEDDIAHFLSLEQQFRSDCEQAIKASDGYEDAKAMSRYLNLTRTAASELGILDEIEPFGASAPNEDAYYRLTAEVDALSVRYRIRSTRRHRRYSVPLDQVERAKITHHLTQLKAEVHKLDVTDAKRDALLNRIAAFESELTRPRARMETFAAVILETATTMGDAANKLEPVWQTIERVARALGMAKEKDRDNPALPSPEEQKKLEGPKRRLPPPKQQ